MAAKRRDLINQPLERIWSDLARAAIAAMPGWQPIDTAPEDFGAVIDLWAQGERQTDCCWMWPTYGVKEYAWCRHAYDDCDGPVYNVVMAATHWMLPPAAPEVQP